MKFFTLTFALLLLLLPARVTAQQPDAEDMPVKDFGGYKVGKDEWRVLVIPKGVSKERLTKVAKALHETFPSTRYHFFDDDKEVLKFVLSKRGLSTPFPEKWFYKHHVGSLQTMLYDRRGLRWYLLDGDTIKIEDFGPAER